MLWAGPRRREEGRLGLPSVPVRPPHRHSFLLAGNPDTNRWAEDKFLSVLDFKTGRFLGGKVSLVGFREAKGGGGGVGAGRGP